MNKEYFIADTHFGHRQIIDYEDRPFTSVEEMDEILIKNWNETVDNNDTIYMLGDFAFYDKDKIKEICSKLNGNKILVKGNHDTLSVKDYMECGFIEVSSYPIIVNGFFILSHAPLYMNNNMPYVNIFGHVHNNGIYTDYSKKSFCACVERIEYKPVSLEYIKEQISK